MPVIQFTVPAVPVPQPRQRHRIVTARAGNQFVANYTERTHPVQGYKACVQIAARQAYQGPPHDGPVSVFIVFLMPRPCSMMWKNKPMPSVAHTKKPDADNLYKSTVDALTGMLWRDDAQICKVGIEKLYAAGNEQPGVRITVEME